MFMDALNSAYQVFLVFLSFVIFIVKVQEYDVCQIENRLDDLLLNFTLTVHKYPTISILISFIKENVNLTVGEDIIVKYVKILVITIVGNCHDIQNFSFTTGEKTISSDSIRERSYSFRFLHREDEFLVIDHLEVQISESCLTIHDQRYCGILAKIMIESCSQAHIS
jgi:hypothetical protein